MSLDEGKSNSRLHKLGKGRGEEEYWHELLTQGFLGLFGSSSVFSHDWSVVSKGNHKCSHSLLLSTQTITKKTAISLPFPSDLVRVVRAFSHVRGHFPVSCVLLDRLTKICLKTKYLHSTNNVVDNSERVAPPFIKPLYSNEQVSIMNNILNATCSSCM